MKINIINTSIFFLIFSFLSFESNALPWSKDMWDHPSIKPYEEAREYPKNNIRKEEERREVSRAEYEEVVNGPNRGKASIDKGKELYQTYCYVCHGMDGGGYGPVIKNDLRKNAYFYPVNLKQAQTQKRTDGYIFAYIRYGGKVMMPAYGRITETEAWDIVYYVRYLQGKVK